MNDSTPGDIIKFWRDAGRGNWFGKSDAFDAEITARFLVTHERATQGGLVGWEHDADGALALLLMLDQFPRNMFRGDARAFATDALARRIAKNAIAEGFDKRSDRIVRMFFYLPLMHSETAEDQDQSLLHFKALGDPDQLSSAVIHRDVIKRFGRFPHRNHALGRLTTPDEQKYLDDGGFAG